MRESDTQSVDLQLNEPEHKRVRHPLGNALANFLSESPFKSAKRTLKVLWCAINHAVFS